MTAASHARAWQIVLEYANARTAWLRFYRMDVELMFSHTPFVRGSVDQVRACAARDRTAPHA